MCRVQVQWVSNQTSRYLFKGHYLNYRKVKSKDRASFLFEICFIRIKGKVD